MPRRATRAATRSALACLADNIPVDSTTPRSKNTKSVMPGSGKNTTPHRLKKKAKLALTPRSGGGSIQECIICMETCGTEGGKMTLRCHHSFCRQCVATHAARQVRHELPPSCPMCKGNLTVEEVVRCGPARDMLEESDDEDDEEPTMIIMEFEDEDGEGAGFWLMFDPEEDYDSEEEGEEDYESGEEGYDSGVEPEEANTDADESNLQGGKEDGDEGQSDAEDAIEDPRPYGGWRWSESHHAWVGSTSVSCPPPRGPPNLEWEGPDPLAGQSLRNAILVEESDAVESEASAEGDSKSHPTPHTPAPAHTADGVVADGVDTDPEAVVALTRAARRMMLGSEPAA